VSIALAIVGVWLGAALVVGGLWALVGLGLRRGRCPSDQVEPAASAQAYGDGASSTEVTSSTEVAPSTEIAPPPEIAAPPEVASPTEITSPRGRR
jgi:hypothetical protein